MNNDDGDAAKSAFEKGVEKALKEKQQNLTEAERIALRKKQWKFLNIDEVGDGK